MQSRLMPAGSAWEVAAGGKQVELVLGDAGAIEAVEYLGETRTELGRSGEVMRLVLAGAAAAAQTPGGIDHAPSRPHRPRFRRSSTTSGAAWSGATFGCSPRRACSRSAARSWSGCWCCSSTTATRRSRARPAPPWASSRPRCSSAP
ncbi:MAG: RodZ domain-containing protein [Thermoanaerobaculaceae bacterium]